MLFCWAALKEMKCTANNSASASMINYSGTCCVKKSWSVLTSFNDMLLSQGKWALSICSVVYILYWAIGALCRVINRTQNAKRNNNANSKPFPGGLSWFLTTRGGLICSIDLSLYRNNMVLIPREHATTLMQTAEQEVITFRLNIIMCCVRT